MHKSARGLCRTGYYLKIAFTQLVCIFLSLVYLDGRAHHSNSIYDRRSEVSIEGTILRYEWKNPHVYIFLEQESDGDQRVVWEIEGSPRSVLKRLGWTQKTLKIGDRIVIKGFLGHNPSKPVALMTAIRKNDERSLQPMLEFNEYLE